MFLHNVTLLHFAVKAKSSLSITKVYILFNVRKFSLQYQPSQVYPGAVSAVKVTDSPIEIFSLSNSEYVPADLSLESVDTVKKFHFAFIITSNPIMNFNVVFFVIKLSSLSYQPTKLYPSLGTAESSTSLLY